MQLLLSPLLRGSLVTDNKRNMSRVIAPSQVVRGDDDDFCYKRVQTPGMSPPRAGAWTYCLFTP